MRAKSRTARLVLGFYASAEHAEEALHEVRKSHFRRSAVVHRAEDGRFSILSGGTSQNLRMALALALPVVLAFVGRALGVHGWVQAVLALSGLLAVWIGAPRWGVPKGILRRHGRFVLPGESLVIVQSREARAPDVLEVLRRVAHPSAFVIRPALRLSPPRHPDETLREPVTMAALPACAVELSHSHRVDTSPRLRSLLPALRECEVAIERSRRDLGEAARLDYGVAHAAEWLLDNTYLIRSHIAEIRHNLPDNHMRILPAIADTRSPVRLRIYHVAADLMHRTGYRFTTESIVTYLDFYQQQAPLTIAELWVFPLMVRLVLLERLRGLSELSSVRQHEKEMADFWANRLLNAAHRNAEQFEEILRELDRDGTWLTPHFVARLGEQLHQEESALAPLQKWIEAKTGSRLADMNLREHAEEANDLMFISTAIGSLRQLSELHYSKIVESVSRMEAVLREDPSGIHSRSDFATRDRCRQIVEETARQSKASELTVARLAVELAAGAAKDTRKGCVSFYLLDEGLPELEKHVRPRLSWRQRCLRFLYRRPTLCISEASRHSPPAL